jgi:phytanoyl-CoA hydroxylase
MLTQDEVAHYRDRGWLRVPSVFAPDELAEISNDLDQIIDEWASEGPGWPGPWRKLLMDEETEKKSTLIGMFEFHLFSATWTRVVTNQRLVECMVDLLGPDVELHQSTLHAKPPGAGMPFPLHQDYPFYPHADDRFVAVLVHLDDTRHENGEIRFADGSHKLGPLEHVKHEDQFSAPYLPVDEWPLEKTVPVPAKAGDIVCFNINTVHGSYVNQTNRIRRMVRLGYRVPDNRQISGQNFGRAGTMVAGRRRRQEGQTADDIAFGGAAAPVIG